MSIEVMLVQLLVLGFTGVLWWIARRDLASRVPPSIPAEPPPGTSADMAELEQLCATLAALVTSLTRRLDAVERLGAERQPALRPSDPPQISEPAKIAPAAFEKIAPAAPVAALTAAPGFTEPKSLAEVRGLLEPQPRSLPEITLEAASEDLPKDPAEDLPDPRYTLAYTLLETGVSDPVEIARQTGLGRGEVDLILSLRDRRVF